MNESEVVCLASGRKLALEFNRVECELLVISPQPGDPRTYTLTDVTSKEYSSYLADPAALLDKIAILDFESAIPLHWEGNI